jgi:hypothetical protein
MLQEFRQAIPQKPYDGRMSLLPLLQSDIETLDGRLELLFKTTELIDWLYKNELEDGEGLPNIQYIREQLAKASTYNSDRKILGHLFSNILRELSFEFIKENNNEFDYNIATEAAEGKRPYTDFVLKAGAVSQINIIWAFTDAEGNQYSGKGIKDGLALKNNELIAVLSNYKGENEEVNEAIKFVLDPANAKIVKKEYKQDREKLMSAFKLAIYPTQESKILDIYKKHK